MLLAMVLALGLGAPPQDLAVPKNDGWVTDLADVLTQAEEQSLEVLMESYKTGTNHEIAVLTIPSLEGASLERFALEVGREWGLGQKESNNGALLLVAKDDRKMRIEVGRGLEGNLTDAISGRIIRDVIAPAFRSQGYFAGIHGGVRAMHSAIGGDYGPINNTQAGRRSARDRSRGIPGVLINVFFLFLFLVSMAMRRGQRGRRSSGGILPWLILGSMNSGGRSRGGGFGGGGGGFSGFGGGGGFSGGGASGGW